MSFLTRPYDHGASAARLFASAGFFWLGDDAEIRYEAAGACGELGGEDAVPRLIELVIDSDIEVQLAAIQALGKIGGSKAKECLEQCMDNPSVAIQEAAEQSLYELEEDPLSFRI